MNENKLKSVNSIKIKTSLRAKSLSPVRDSRKISLEKLKTISFTLSPEEVKDIVINMLLMSKEGDVKITGFRKGLSDGRYQITVTSQFNGKNNK